MNRAEIGAWGEETAVNHLTSLGYKIIDRNYHARCGEIDIIAQMDNYICFVEVRTRAEDALVSGLESIDLRKMRKIFRTACVWLSCHKVDLQPRFDVIEITASKNAEKTVKNLTFITNAFGAEVCSNEFF